MKLKLKRSIAETLGTLGFLFLTSAITKVIFFFGLPPRWEGWRLPVAVAFSLPLWWWLRSWLETKEEADV